MLKSISYNILQYFATKYYELNNYFNNVQKEPILYIKNTKSDQQTKSNLEFQNCFGINYKSMIAHINTLSNGSINLDIEELRNSKLEYITFDNDVEPIKYYKQFQNILDNLPETLTYLSINYNKNACTTLPLSDTSHFLIYDKFPIGIKTLELLHIEITNQLDNLPPNLETLNLRCNRFKNTLEYLPYSLKTLNLSCVQFDSVLSNLPPNLETLILEIQIENTNKQIHCNMLQSLNNLPNSIKELKLFIDIGNYNGFVIDKLPANLEYLQLSNSTNIITYHNTSSNKYKFQITTLPDTLETFIIINNCVSNSPDLEVRYPDIAFEYFGYSILE